MTHVQLTEKARIDSIDLLRGLVMIIMALDHTRDFFHNQAQTLDPTDLSQTTPALFFTRWITHFCAPVFVFLSGVSARLMLQRKSKQELSRFLLTRGLWLIVLEVTILRFIIFGNWYYDFTMFQVIWAIGASMVVLSALVYLKDKIILSIGLVILAGHNVLDSFQLSPGDGFYPVAMFLYQFSFTEIAPNHFILVNYPLLPWLGILLTGYGIGSWFLREVSPERRQKFLLQAGVFAVTAFLVLRFINVYGDPAPWSVQKNFLFTVMSFLNCTKYPVSLMFSLMTVGPALLLLCWLEKKQVSFKPIIIYGRVPFFYYIFHFSLIHVTALAAYLLTPGNSFSSLDFHFREGFLGGLPKDSGYSLPWVYIAWACIVLFLYPFCKWYNTYKSTHAYKWLSYL